MPTTTSASTRPAGRPRWRWRRPATLVAAVVLLVGIAAACEPDTTPPIWGEFDLRDVSVSTLGPHAVVAWPAASGAPTRYRIDVDGASVTMPTGAATSCVLVGLAAASTYEIEISAYDAAGNWSGSPPGPVGRQNPTLTVNHTTRSAGPNGGPTQRCVPTTDTDLDRLPDALETGTGTYAHTASTGSSPTLLDSDQDGMDDGDEALGTPGGLDLLGLGARPQRRDLIVEMDWLTGITAPARTPCSSVPNLQPTAARVQTAIAAYADFPVDTPLGGDGINLIVDRGQGGAFTGGNAITDADGRLDMRQARTAHMAANRVGYVHYSLTVIDFYVFLAGFYTGGLAPKPGDVLTIGQGCGTSVDDFEVGAILTHELGHNADLNHGGHDAINGKPNYNSLMNYRFAYGADLNCDGLSDPTPTRQLRWSDVARPAIDEASVREWLGACGDGGDDLNGNGTIQSSAYSYDLSGNGTIEVLEGSNDADHLSLGKAWPRHRSGGAEGEDVYDPEP